MSSDSDPLEGNRSLIEDRAELLEAFLHDGGVAECSEDFLQGGLFMAAWMQHRMEELMPSEQVDQTRPLMAMTSAVWTLACRKLKR